MDGSPSRIGTSGGTKARVVDPKEPPPLKAPLRGPTIACSLQPLSGQPGRAGSFLPVLEHRCGVV